MGLLKRGRTALFAVAAVAAIMLPAILDAQTSGFICPENGAIHLTHNGVQYIGTVVLSDNNLGTCTYSFYAEEALGPYDDAYSRAFIEGTADASTAAILAAEDQGLVPAYNIQVDDEGSVEEGVDDPWDDGGPPEDPLGGNGPIFYGLLDDSRTAVLALV